MKTQPIAPARVEFGDGPPRAPDFDDLYHPQVGALAQARHVFLRGNGLPARWAGRPDFTVLETGFGLGLNFLATWDAWRSDPARGERLHYVAVDRHPPTRADLARALAGAAPGGLSAALAAALVAAWPPLTPNLHPLQFDGGRVRLLLGWGDARVLLRELELQADAVYLDGFAPDRNPEMWSRPLIGALARRLRHGATAATWSAARPVRDALAAAGFDVEAAPGIGGKREITLARYAPAFGPRRAAARPGADAAAAARDALVVGGGLAGAAVARSLAGLGWCVTVFDRHPAPAMQASGNPAGLFHGTVHADDGRHARFNRAAALLAARRLGEAFAAGVPGAADGLLRRVPPGTTLQALHARIDAMSLPPDYVQGLDEAAAGAAAGLPWPGPAWWFTQGGWADPGALVRHWLATPGIAWRGGTAVQRIAHEAHRWRLLDAGGQVLAAAPVLVIAAAADAAVLLGPQGERLPPMQRSRGQLSWWPLAPAGAPQPRCPLVGDGYALALPGGGLLFGATNQPGDDDPAPRAADHLHNVERLQRLAGPWPDGAAPPPQGRVAWRTTAGDRLPVAGAVPAAPVANGARLDQVRFVPREPGLFVVTALASRGIGWAPLLGDAVAARIAGTPAPLEADLAAAIDPARSIVRAARTQR